MTPAIAASTARVQVPVGPLLLEAPVSLRPQAELLARRAAPVLPRVEAEIGASPAAPYRIFLIPAGPLSDPDLQRLDASAPPWAAGFLHSGARIGALRMGQADRYPHSDLLSVLIHESVHMALHDAAQGLPRWFQEGVATRSARRWGPRDAVIYSSALLSGSLPSLAEMDRSFRSSAGRARIAYASSFGFVSWAENRHGADLIRRVLANAREMPFPQAWETATGWTLEREEAAWRRRSVLRYRWLPLLGGTTTLWIGITLLFLVAAARRRARSRAILARWEREEGPSAPW